MTNVVEKFKWILDQCLANRNNAGSLYSTYKVGYVIETAVMNGIIGVSECTIACGDKYANNQLIRLINIWSGRFGWVQVYRSY